MKRTLVVIPTYQERENIESLLERTFQQPAELWVLIVDDNSPDGTGELVESLKKQYPRLDILHRSRKEGLGPAYQAGFFYALEKGFDQVVSMDADLSHDPRYIADFLESLEVAHLVIGSRYLNGISVVNWSLKRLILSYFANRYVQWVTRLPVRDCTSGFMAFRREVLEKIPWQKTLSLSYSFLIELKYFSHRMGFRLLERPIIFVERKRGETKLSPFTILEAMGTPWKLIMNSHPIKKA